MNNYYAPCFYRIEFVVIHSYIELPWKEVLCSLRAKNLLNSNDIAESEENGIPNLPTANFVHIKPVELDKDVQPSNLNS